MTAINQQIDFLNRNSFIAEYLWGFHDLAFIIIISVITFVRGILISAYKTKFICKNLLAHQILELIWTILPTLILIVLAIPSLGILFLIEDSTSCQFSVKVIGNQWFWEYENRIFSLQKNESFARYMTPFSKDRAKDLFRLLDCSSSLILPTDIPIRVLVSSNDVLHSWTLPSLGVKVDACPGRLNELIILAQRTGLFFGQCSEICGANHRFMPIRVKIVNPELWLSSKNNLIKIKNF